MRFSIAIVGVTLIAGALGQTSPEPLENEEADMGLYDIVEGDILVPKVAYKQVTNRLWPNAIVPYVISSEMSDEQKKYVLLGQQLIEKHTCVRFQKRINQGNYVEYINGDGCYSFIGRKGGKQPVSLGRGCEDVTVSAHEAMHALGIFHEQSRPDRDDFITVNLDNVRSSEHHNFDKAIAQVVTVPRPFDFKSIMLYDPYTFSSNGRASIVSKVSGQRMLRRTEKPAISEGDIFLINHLYHCPATKATSAPPTTTPTIPSGNRRYPSFDSKCSAGRWALRNATRWWCEPKVTVTVAPSTQPTPSPVTARRYPSFDSKCSADSWAMRDHTHWWCVKITTTVAPSRQTTPTPVTRYRYPSFDSKCPAGQWAMADGKFWWCETK